MTSLLRQNDAATSFWRYNDVFITSCVRWERIRYWFNKIKLWTILIKPQDPLGYKHTVFSSKPIPITKIRRSRPSHLYHGEHNTWTDGRRSLYLSGPETFGSIESYQTLNISDTLRYIIALGSNKAGARGLIWQTQINPATSWRTGTVDMHFRFTTLGKGQLFCNPANLLTVSLY